MPFVTKATGTPIRQAVTSSRNRENWLLFKVSRYYHSCLDKSQLALHLSLPVSSLLRWKQLQEIQRSLSSGAIAQNCWGWKLLKCFYLVTKSHYSILIMLVPITQWSLPRPPWVSPKLITHRLSMWMAWCKMLCSPFACYCGNINNNDNNNNNFNTYNVPGLVIYTFIYPS